MKTTFTLEHCNGPYAKWYSPNLTMEKCFEEIARLIEWAKKEGKYVTFAGGDNWEPKPEKNEVVVQICEYPEYNQVAFYHPIIHLPRSAGGTWNEFDLWYKKYKQNKQQVEIK